MTPVSRTSVAASCLAGLLLVAGLAAAGCASHSEESGALAEATNGTTEIMKLIADEEIILARERFQETHGALHLTATELESVDPEIAEVVNDITEVLQNSFLAEPVNRQQLMDLTERTLVTLDEAHFALNH